MNASQRFLTNIKEVFEKYITHGARSSKKVDLLHEYFVNEINEVINMSSNKEIYQCKMEHNVPSCNASGRKKCDIVVLKNGLPFIILPVKFIMTNYKQNKNNSWENVTGELCHIHWADTDKQINIIPINIIFDKVPYLKTDKKIQKYENITYTDSFKIYESLFSQKIVFDQMNYIINVNHICEVNTFYDKCPNILGFHSDTPYRSFHEILHTLIQ
jgi:hypothetical protein